MRHKGSNPIIIKGKRVILSEVVPEYFEYIILWRNNKRLNKYINQSFELTIDSQYKWYREKYLVDPTQGFFVMLEKATNRPFATIGWTDMDVIKKRCVGGRLLMPDKNDSGLLVEGSVLFWDYLLQHVDNIYIHVAKMNKRALRWNKAFGFREHDGSEKWEYPEYKIINNIPHIEITMKKSEYLKAKEKYDLLKLST